MNTGIKPEADYEIGGGWGNAINWTNPEIFSGALTEDTIVSVVGWKAIRPEKGQTLVGEFVKSWILFKFIEVEYCSDPNDMFFAKVKAIKQVMKE